MIKKLITIAAISVFAGMFFSSCGSNHSIQKRHYTKGYYFSHHKHSHISTASNDENVLEREQNIAQISKLRSDSDTTQLIFPLQKPVYGNGMEEIADDDKIVHAKAIKKEHKPVKQFLALSSLKHTSGKIKSNLAHVRHIFSDSAKLDKKQMQDEGYSLFWIVILILLILWAIGFISNGFLIASLINLILLVALILLILWLLRVI